MEKNHEKIKDHAKKYNRTYLLYFLDYVVVVSLAILLNAPILFIPLLILIIIHALTRCVDVAEMDILMNGESFSKDTKDRTNE